MKQTILVTGGAGYIGSHTVLELLQHDYHVIVIDLNCSYQIHHPHVLYFQCDIADTPLVKSICSTYQVDAVIHCAAYSQVATSVVNPALYYHNNVSKTITFLDTIRSCAISRIIFSSSAAVYGTPNQVPIPEHHPCNPINPYGNTKMVIETVLADYARAYRLQSVSLRYFNAAGGHPEYNLGERHEPETHLIPLFLHAALNGKPCTIFGDDYATADGTCVRDYVHVRDIARAHRLALEYIHHSGNLVLNLGTARGYSIKEIIVAIEQVTEKTLIKQYAPRRNGDPAILIADTAQAQHLLHWQPEMSDITTLVASTYKFMTMQNSIDRMQHISVQQSHTITVL